MVLEAVEELDWLGPVDEVVAAVTADAETHPMLARLFAELTVGGRRVVARAAGVRLETLFAWARGDGCPTREQAADIEKVTGGLIKVSDWPALADRRDAAWRPSAAGTNDSEARRLE